MGTRLGTGMPHPLGRAKCNGFLVRRAMSQGRHPRRALVGRTGLVAERGWGKKVPANPTLPSRRRERPPPPHSTLYRGSCLSEKAAIADEIWLRIDPSCECDGPSWRSCLPLDGAALGRGLRRVGLPSGQHRVERGAKPGRVLRWIVVVGVRSASVAQLQT